MKAFLLFKDRDFDAKCALPWNEQVLTQDLELDTLFGGMARGDKFLFDVARAAVLRGLGNDLDTILYRQNILWDCLRNPAVARALYDVAVAAIEGEKGSYWSFFGSKYPGGILHRAIESLQMFVTMLKRLKGITDEHAGKFESEGFRKFFAMLQRELDPAYFARIDEHLNELKFRNGILFSAELGKGNKGTGYVLRKTPVQKRNMIDRIFGPKPLGYTFHLHPRDESGAKALSTLKDKGLNLSANALAQSGDHILSFFNMLRTELAFYLGCVNLHEQLSQQNEPTCFPAPTAERAFAFEGLYDVCLSLKMAQQIVGNDVNADGKELVIITGANQGGKSTFLRSVGLAQLMMQAGMFVSAESFRSELCDRLFTHYKREEDVTMKSGKFDEELSRMSEIVDRLTSSSMILFNESFAATNEREGSEIAKQIVTALLRRHVRIFFVTHLYEFAHGLCAMRMQNAIFLRAERHSDGVRTFRLVEGEPLQTSYGKDLYDAIFTGHDRSPNRYAAPIRGRR
ncbi:MAG: DNA mismatch repair protein MutS [Methylovirgula sp.]